ncbi:MAG: hypothetical protein KME12_23525 [Trichocoleus desertorum ATA4-8-CV12]|jgi:hypothetical protein|nr:hypothetical protein [Trichocoleus desertorum ATA4-8-CV12]
MKQLPIYDHYPSPEEWGTVSSLSESELQEIIKFRGSHLKAFAELIEGALWQTGAMRQIKRLGWDVLKKSDRLTLD